MQTESLPKFSARGPKSVWIMLLESPSLTSLFSFAMAIIAFNDKNLPKNPAKSNVWMERALQQLEQIVTVLNGKNAVMFESEGSFIHLATGGVLFKGKRHQQWRFKPFPGERTVRVLDSDELNQQINRSFNAAMAAKKTA